MLANAAPCAIETRQKQIEERAYALWESEGRPDGRDLVHWCQAESEVMAAGTAGSDTDLTSSTVPSLRRTKAADARG
jgi:hypothetical protein